MMDKAAKLHDVQDIDVLDEQIILEEKFDEDYEPTQEEIEEYAKFLGMDLEHDQDLLWIAKEGLKAPLPLNWKPCKTGPDGEMYYFNFLNGESLWDHPCDEYYKKFYEQEKLRRARNLTTPVEGGTSTAPKNKPRPLVLESSARTSDNISPASDISSSMHSLGGSFLGSPLSTAGLDARKGPLTEGAPSSLLPATSPTVLTASHPMTGEGDWRASEELAEQKLREAFRQRLEEERRVFEVRLKAQVDADKLEFQQKLLRAKDDLEEQEKNKIQQELNILVEQMRRHTEEEEAHLKEEHAKRLESLGEQLSTAEGMLLHQLQHLEQQISGGKKQEEEQNLKQAQDTTLQDDDVTGHRLVAPSLSHEALDTHLASKEEHLRSLRSQVDALTQQLQEVEIELKARRILLENLEVDLAAKQRLVLDADKELHEVISSLGVKQRALAEKEASLQRLMEDINEKESLVMNHQQELADLTSCLELTKQEEVHVKAQLEERSRALSNLEGQIATRMKELEVLEETLTGRNIPEPPDATPPGPAALNHVDPPATIQVTSQSVERTHTMPSGTSICHRGTALEDISMPSCSGADLLHESREGDPLLARALQYISEQRKMARAREAKITHARDRWRLTLAALHRHPGGHSLQCSRAEKLKDMKGVLEDEVHCLNEDIRRIKKLKQQVKLLQHHQRSGTAATAAALTLRAEVEASLAPDKGLSADQLLQTALSALQEVLDLAPRSEESSVDRPGDGGNLMKRLPPRSVHNTKGQMSYRKRLQQLHQEVLTIKGDQAVLQSLWHKSSSAPSASLQDLPAAASYPTHNSHLVLSRGPTPPGALPCQAACLTAPDCSQLCNLSCCPSQACTTMGVSQTVMRHNAEVPIVNTSWGLGESQELVIALRPRT